MIIDRRYCGPDNSANGGYACGVAALQLQVGLGRSIQVTLRSPPPLDTPFAVERVDDRAIVRDGDNLVAEAAAVELAVQPPAAVTFDEAIDAARRYPWQVEHPYPRCFVCGPDRAAGDGLRIFPGAVAGRDVAAAPWIPMARDANADGRVRTEIVWAALDCPSLFGAVCFGACEERVLLGRLAVRIDEAPEVDERCVCVGWLIERDGRKVHVGSALYSADGQVRAIARATWITVAPAV